MPGDQRPEEFGEGRLFQLTSEAIVAADLADETIVLWNPAAVALFGYTAEEAVGMRLDHLVPNAVRDDHLAGLRRYHHGGDAVLVGAGPVVVPAMTKSHETRDVALSLTDVSPDDDRRIVLAIIRDVTAQLNTERELAAANRSLREFVASASHDLRNPLTAVLGFARLLADTDHAVTDQQRQSWATAIIRAAQAASRLVDDLLMLSQIQSGAVVVRAGRVKVAEAVAELAARMTSPVQCEIDPDVAVFADPDHLRRMVDNYLSNAIRYGEAPIIVRATTDTDMIELRVLDAGPGVPDAFVDRLFTRFARADPTRSDSTGLGLSIVKGLAEANGGRAFYERTGASTCFVVTLPAESP